MIFPLSTSAASRLGLRFLSLAAAFSLLVWTSGCASGPDKVGFTKVKYYHLKEQNRRAESMSIDPMLRFERQHFLHGAVTVEEKRDRVGHYYTMFWNAGPHRGPVTLRFAYRQSKAGERIFTHEQLVKDVKARNTTSFRITGGNYHRFGRVVAWEATLLESDRVIDTTRSFLWK